MSFFEGTLVAVALLSFSSCGNAQDRVKCGELPPIPDSPASSIPAQTFSSSGGRFKIGLPPRAADKPESYDGSKGHIETTRYKWFVLNHGQYQVSHSDSDRILENATDNKRLFDNLRDLLLSKGTGHLEGDLELKLAGHPGREIKIKDGSGINIQEVLSGRKAHVYGQRLCAEQIGVRIGLSCKSARLI